MAQKKLSEILRENEEKAREEAKKLNQTYNETHIQPVVLPISNKKTFVDKLGFITKSTGTGGLGALTGTGQGLLTDIASNMRKGENESFLSNAINAIKAPIMPSYGDPMQVINTNKENIKEAINILKDKDKTGWEKAADIGLNAVSSVKNTNPTYQLLSSTAKATGKVLPDADEALLKVNETISKPVNKLNQELEEESKDYDKITNFIATGGRIVANMAPSIAATAITKDPSIGLGVMGLSAKGQSTNEALNQGVELDKAVKIGDAKALIEVVTERLSGGVGKVFGKGSLDDVAEEFIKKGFKSKFGKFLAKQGYNILGETAEEWISNIVDNFIDKGTVDPNRRIASLKEALETLGQTAFSTLLLGGMTGQMRDEYRQAKADVQSEQQAQRAISDAQNIINQTTEQQKVLPTQQTTQDNRNIAIEEINNSRIDNQEKQQMIQALNNIETVTDEDLSAIRQTISSINENNLLPTNESYKDNQQRRQAYVKYKNDSSGYNSAVVNNILDAIPENRNGKRTVKQWLQAANEIGQQISGLSNEEIEKTAYRSWFDLEPTKNITQYDSQAKQKVGFQKLTSDEWVNTINNAVNQARENQPVQQVAQPIQQPVVTPSDDLISSAEKYNLKYQDSNLNQVQNVFKNKGIDSRFDASKFTDNKTGAMWQLTRDQDGNVRREIILNPNADEKTVIQEMAIHELTHDIVAKNTDTSTRLYNEVRDWLARDSEYQNQLDQLKSVYGDNVVEEEAIAKTLQTKFGNQESIDNLVNYNPSMARRIYDWVVDKLNKITGGKIEKLYWEDVKNKFERAYSEQGNYNKSKIRFSISQDGKMQENGKNVTLDAETGSNNKTLLAIHNLSEDKLRGVLELGGFPVPSIAITNPDIIDHNQFGDISVVFNKDTINPEYKANEVYDRDVWSPTVPSIHLDINDDNIKNYITNDLNLKDKDTITRHAELNYLYGSNLSNMVDRYGIEETIRQLKNSKELQYLYMKSQNANYEPQMKTKKYSNYHTNETLQRFVDNFNKNHDMSFSDFFYHYINYKDMELTETEKANLIKEIKEAIRPEIREYFDKYIDTQEKKPTQKQIDKFIQEELDSEMESYHKYYDFLHNASYVDKEGINSQTIDEEKTLEKVAKDINKAEYDKWIDNTFGKMFNEATKGIRNDKDPYTPSGNRRSFKQLYDEYNLTNLVKALSKKPTKGGQDTGIFGTGFGRISAQRANRFESIQDIKNNESRIMTREQAEEIIRPISESLFEKVDKLVDYYTRKDYGSETVNRMQGVDNTSELIEDFAGGKLTKERLKKVLGEYNNYDIDKIPDSLLEGIVNDLKEVSKLPTDYFEAKPQRAVGFDEIDAIVIPSDLNTDLKQQLKDRGIKTIEYNRNNENEKSDIIRSLNDYKFSKTAQNFDEYIQNRVGKQGTRTTLGDLKLPVQQQMVDQTTPVLPTNKTMNPTEISKLTEADVTTTPRLPTREYRKGNKQSNFAANILGDAQFIDKNIRQELAKDENVRYYQGITNEQTLEKAYKSLQEGGATETMKWYNKKDNITPEDVAKGWILLKQYQDAGDIQGMIEVAKKMRTMGTQAGQTVQAYNIMSRLTPEGMFYYAQSELSDAFDQFSKDKTQKWIDEHRSEFEITPEETQFIKDRMETVQNANDERTKKVALAEIQSMLQNKIPPTTGQGIKAWMRISMLFNPKTQVRNVMGNTVILPVNTASDVISGVIDKAIAKKTGVRTTGVTKEGLKGYAQGFKRGLFESYDDFRKGINTRNVEGNRFEIGEGKSFKDKGVGKALNAIDNILSFSLDAGDRGFYEATFTNSINNQMVLNNTTEVTPEMIEIATNEALQRTWQDNNAYTKAVLGVRNILNNINVKGYGLGDVLIPFAKTPANLTKAIVDYSPAGLVRTLAVDARRFNNSLNNGQYFAQAQHDFVQNLGKGISGTFLYVLGSALAKAGIITGESDDDKDLKNFMKNTLGINSYSVKIGDKSFTYDWAQPVATPFAIMSNYEKYSKDNPDANALEKGIKALNIGSEQLLEQSFMESINTVLNGNGTTLENLSKAVLDLPARAIPTFSKQIADLVDSKQRTSFEYDKPIQSAVNSLKSKLPFVSKTLPESKDTLGNSIEKYGGENNAFNVMLNPANVNKSTLNKAGKEIYDVYMSTGDTTIFPRVAPYYINSKGEKTTLTSEQRSKFQETSGKYVENAMNGLLNNKDYNKMKNEDKAKLINEIVTDSYAKAKYDVLGMDTDSYKKTRETLKDVSTTTYYDYKIKTSGLKKDKEKLEVLADANYKDKEKERIYREYFNKDDSLFDIAKKGKIDTSQYLKYKANVENTRASAEDYLKKANISNEQKLLLLGTKYKLTTQEKATLAKYINNLSLTKGDKLDIYKQLTGFKVNGDKVSW